MFIKDTEIKIVKGDITELKVDAIVNAANNKLVMGGGVAGAIKNKGGQSIEDEAVKKGPIKIGESAYTKAGSLSAKYVIHSATMGMDFKTDETKIRESCKSALRLAEELKIGSIAFPALGCGTGGFPLLGSAKIISQEVFRHIKEDGTNLKELIFCLYDKEAYAIFNKGIISYLEYIIYKLQNGPFSTVDAIIEINGGIVLIERSNPPFGYALPGGFVDYNESLEDAVRREMKEETDLELEDLKQFHTYSEPGRDPRFHTICTVFIAKGKGKPKAGDDAKGLKIIKPEQIKDLTFAFDHNKILEDYLKYKK
ncbi:MAG: macro domain-containing protein [Candidatus Omnitrophota bacterium]|jgi:O-acetyl-ADP-ribose deacetylase (regulator of RNase III)/ADP-ribose pyrophosphatase YjhB (NUDIX family)